MQRPQINMPGATAAPNKSGAVQFRAVSKTILCTAAFNEHENQKQKFTPYLRKRVSLKSLNVQKRVPGDSRLRGNDA
jgi:hypothetical protein